MANYDYEIVNGRKIRVRPKETVSEIDKNGYFRRQPNHFTTPFGDGENDLKAEGNKRYRLVWAKLCHWSNRAAIVRELEGLEDQISVNMVEHAPHEKNLGWEYVYNENNIDPVLGDQFLSEAYYRADDDYQGRTTVPALIDTTTGKVVNNDYNWLTTYFEVNFRPWHKKGAPELYPVELREEIDKMNLWLFDNINNAVYRSSFSRSNEGHFDGVNTFYAAMDRLEKRLETNRFLFGDYVTDSDIRLYVTLARLDIRYTAQLGETKRPLYTYKNLCSAKLDLCIELIQSAVEAGHKILLFSQFTSMIEILTARLQKENIRYFVLQGSTKKEQRARMVEEFNRDDTSVFCISLKAGGTGLNLTGADIVIHYDPWWNVAVENQATDRAHRIGQKNVVTVYKLITKGTIEEKIIKLQQMKKELAEEVLSGDEIKTASFQRDELLELLEERF